MNRRAFLRGLPTAPMLVVPTAASSEPVPFLQLELLPRNEPNTTVRMRLNGMFSAVQDAINELSERVRRGR